MQLGLYGAACLMALMLTIGITTRTAGNNAEGQQTGADLTNFRNYLEEVKPGKTWQSGPTPLDSAEIRKAYGNLRFYYVYSSPPLPPGAPLQELLEEFELKMKAYQEQFISLTMSFDEQGKMAPLQKAADYNQGLMRVTTDDDAKIAAAAILSLYYSDRVGPGIVAANEVTVTRNENGWSCSVDRENDFQGTVIFDKEGKLVSVTKTYAGSLPS
jgi:hypothetical protein